LDDPETVAADSLPAPEKRFALTDAPMLDCKKWLAQKASADLQKRFALVDGSRVDLRKRPS
jgi:hypothetical protein